MLGYYVLPLVAYDNDKPSYYCCLTIAQNASNSHSSHTVLLGQVINDSTIWRVILDFMAGISCCIYLFLVLSSNLLLWGANVMMQ